MITEILNYADKIEAALKTLKFGFIIGIIINVIIAIALFKVTDIFIRKLKEHTQKSDSTALSSHLIPILDKIIKFLILFFISAKNDYICECKPIKQV